MAGAVDEMGMLANELLLYDYNLFLFILFIPIQGQYCPIYFFNNLIIFTVRVFMCMIMKIKIVTLYKFLTVNTFVYKYLYC